MIFDIQKRRKALNLTLEQVADAVGVSKSTVKKWESGYIQNMRRDKIKKLADSLGVSPLEILEAVDKKDAFLQKAVPLTQNIKKKYTDFLVSAFGEEPCFDQNLIIISQGERLVLLTQESSAFQNIMSLIK